MARNVKSLRLDQWVIDLTEDYLKQTNAMFGDKISFANLVETALLDFIATNATKTADRIRCGSLVQRLPNGKFRAYEFPEETVNQLEQIGNNAMGEIFDREGGIWGNT